MNINVDFINFIVTVVFSFLVGLEIKTYRIQFHDDSKSYFFGTTRTFTFVGILGFIFYRIDLSAYLVVLAGLTFLYGLFYFQKLQAHKQSILLYLVMLIVYSFGPLSVKFPIWMDALVFVIVVFVLNAKEEIHKFSIGFNTYEFEILGKMILLSAVILPLLPKNNVIPYIPLSPFKIWLAVVVISAISYAGYIVQKYFFPTKGFFLTGLIGGTYSSTATTVVLSRKSKELGKDNVIDAAIIAATSVMYIRLIIVAMIFNMAIAKVIALPFIVLSVVGFVISFFYLRVGKKDIAISNIVDKNPLELGTAFIFAFLFVIMIMLTHFITIHYGSSGLKIFSFIVGFTDIDPFILSLLTGKYVVSQAQIVNAILIAAGSNNLIKAVYALYFGKIKNSYRSAFWISLLGVLSIGWAFLNIGGL
jgi:uncharacterized membrane protein (DUF4010 family)